MSNYKSQTPIYGPKTGRTRLSYEWCKVDKCMKEYTQIDKLKPCGECLGSGRIETSDDDGATWIADVCDRCKGTGNWLTYEVKAAVKFETACGNDFVASGSMDNRVKGTGDVTSDGFAGLDGRLNNKPVARLANVDRAPRNFDMTDEEIEAKQNLGSNINAGEYKAKASSMTRKGGKWQ